MIGTADEYQLPVRVVSDNPKSSEDILNAIIQAEREMRDFDENARRIDQIYSGRQQLGDMLDTLGLEDQEYDLFWASMEVLKPAIYAKPPNVVAKPRYSDASPAAKVAAEVIERVVNSEFERSNIDLALREVRDDLALLNRGVLWVDYETEEGKRICVDHVDRRDFLHEPSRYWSETGWVARRGWLNEKQMKERFSGKSGDAYLRANYISARQDFEEGARDDTQKAAVWSFWSKTNKKVYWVSEGVDVILDESDPPISLRDFFPCPRPAYGTLKRRTLVPVPDYLRYEPHLDQINFLTSRIYSLLERVRLVGLLPAGGDIGKALETAMAETGNDMFIPVPAGSLMTGAGDYIQWVPIDMIANTITGLIQARTQLFSDFDRLSGISDIMRGETEANETYGAQQLKSQYGSVRVKDKTDEIVRVSRDTARISTELVCTNFDQETLLDIAQMEIPSRKDVDKEIRDLTKAAKEEMEALTAQAQEAIQQGGEGVDRQQVQQQLQQAQAQLAEKYRPQFERLQHIVVVEDVMEIIKDRKERGLIIDIETDSTVIVDEMAQKRAGSEMLQAFSSAIGSMLPLFQIGEQGVKLAATVLRVTMQPYTRGNRMLEAQLDELVENAPEIAAKMAEQQGGGDDQGLAEANKALAEAEQVKAQAAMAGVQAKAAEQNAENQRKIAELIGKQQESERKHQVEMAKLQQSADDAAVKASQAEREMEAKIDKLRADTYKVLVDAGIARDQQALNQFKTVADIDARSTDQAMTAERNQRADMESDRSAEMGERQQNFSEQQAINQGGE